MLSGEWACTLHPASFLSAGHSEHGGPCPRGHFCPSGTSHPQPCPAGSYNNLTGQASCFPCPAGYSCPENISTYSERPCPAGFSCPRGECLGHQLPEARLSSRGLVQVAGAGVSLQQQLRITQMFSASETFLPPVPKASEGLDPSQRLSPKQLTLSGQFHVFSLTFKIMRVLLSVP